jgi:hypothetical protein
MKTPFSLLTFLIISICFSFSPKGFGIGGQDGNGGDVQEKQFLDIANDIASWILKGGPKELQYPAGLDLANYSNKMLQAIDPKVTAVSFDNQPIMRDGFERVCEILKVNSPNQGSQSKIHCNINRFKYYWDIGFGHVCYEVVHHTYAVIAGIEPEQDENSYFITDQIREFTQNKIISKLGILNIRKNNGSISNRIQQFSTEQDLNSCKGSFCRLFSLSINENGVVTSVILNRSVYKMISSYMKTVTANKILSPAQQALNILNEGLLDIIGQKVATRALSDWPNMDHRLATLMQFNENGAKIVSLYIDINAYKIIQSYLESTMSIATEGILTLQKLSPAQESVLNFFSTIFEKVKRPEYCPGEYTPVSDQVYGVMMNHIRSIINTQPGVSPVYDEFTPSQQSMLNLFLGFLF